MPARSRRSGRLPFVPQHVRGIRRARDGRSPWSHNACRITRNSSASSSRSAPSNWPACDGVDRQTAPVRRGPSGASRSLGRRPSSAATGPPSGGGARGSERPGHVPGFGVHQLAHRVTARAAPTRSAAKKETSATAAAATRRGPHGTGRRREPAAAPRRSGASDG